MKKIDLDFTSLLDIMLILLFVFLLNSNTENLEKEEAAQAQITESQLAVDEAVNSLRTVQAENQLLVGEAAKHKAQISELQQQMEDLLSAPSQLPQTWHNYQAIRQKFLFLNIHIAAPHNQLIINEKTYPLFITVEDAQDEVLRTAKRNAIEDILEKEINGNKDSYRFILLSAGKDLRIPRLAYTLLWEAIKEIESKYGTDKVFKTEFYMR